MNWSPNVAAIALAGASVATLEGQTVRGTVVDAVTSDPIADASVVLLDTRERIQRGTLTEADGTYELNVAEAGTYTIRAGASNYLRWDSPPIRLRPLEPLDLEIRLTPEGSGVDLSAFMRRRARGIGYFLTGEQLERRSGDRFSDAFRYLPGVRIIAGGSIRLVTGLSGADAAGVRQTYEPSADCPPVLYVDGMWRGTIDRANPEYEIPSVEIVAIEIYQRNEVPEEFQRGRDALCGVIVVWRKKGN